MPLRQHFVQTGAYAAWGLLVHQAEGVDSLKVARTCPVLLLKDSPGNTLSASMALSVALMGVSCFSCAGV